MKSDLEIAYENKMEEIKVIADKLGIGDDIESYGRYKAKIDLGLLDKLKDKKDAKVILVTAITPTKAGEGKSTTTIGLADAISALGEKAIVALREPSFGPVLGIKGGACGGGYAQVQPMEDINMHFTGDMHAITTANNTISALIDNHMNHGNELNIDKDHIVWKRCMDLNDRALREIEVGYGKVNGPVRKDGFNITVASEIMAILCLARSYEDLKERVANILIAYDLNGKPLFVRDLKCEGVVTLILKDALKPNLVQTLYHTPVLVHGGPFANIAHGCNSILATKLAMKLADYVVTEAGFGADLGAEKFLDIKAREAGIKPDAVCLVATIRALKMHGGATNYEEENVTALLRGLGNLEKHIDSVKHFGLPFVIAINRFASDTDTEVNLLLAWAKENGHKIALSTVFADGPKGGLELAKLIIEATNSENHYAPIYDLNDTIENKILTIAKKIYGAKDVFYTDQAKANLKECYDNGFDKFYICMAKTPNSLTDDPKVLGAPKDFTITVKEIRVSAGAKFIVVLTGSIMTMPGLPTVPQALKMDFVDGKAKGLF